MRPEGGHRIEPLHASSTGRRRVLIVDDDHDCADALGTALALEGYETAVAYSVAQAQSMIETFEAQVAILDYQLGQMNGVKLLTPLKERRPDMLFILATAFAGLDSAIEALQQGFYDYFRKPLFLDDLLATLDRSFERLRLEEEKRAAEEALREARKTEAVAQVAGGIAHHFNNLIMGMQWHLELLSEKVDGAQEARELVDSLLVASEQASGITHNLLAFTQAELSHPREIDLATLTSEVASEAAGEYRGRAAIECADSETLWPVRIDPLRYEAALACILGNAVEATPLGGRVLIRATNEDLRLGVPGTKTLVPPGRYVVVAVEDEGSGMPPAVAARAFEPFFSGKGLAERVGLGLSVVQGFADQSGGYVTLDSVEGRGTTVRLYIPSSRTRAGAAPAAPVESVDAG